jgi:acetylglutamate kinase
MARKAKAPDGKWLQQARVLSEALPYMRRYAGKTFVIKYGGGAMENPELAGLFAGDVVLLRQVGINPVVVHGGGPQIDAMLKRLGIESAFEDGLRVTSKEAAAVVEMVLSGAINKQIVAAIDEAGGLAVGLSGKDGGLIRAERLVRVDRDAKTGRERRRDWGQVGEPKEINGRLLDVLARAGVIPVIAPVGSGAGGETLNINADTAAGAVAAAVGATRLLMLTDVPGVLDARERLIPELTAAEARAAIASGVVKGGMIPKIETCLKAVEGGCEGAVIIDGRVRHAILIELFTEHGAGTLVKAS